jgi:transposase-like protein
LRALTLIQQGVNPHAAAKAEGLHPSTIYRALAQQRKRNESIRPESEIDADEYTS